MSWVIFWTNFCILVVGMVPKSAPGVFRARFWVDFRRFWRLLDSILGRFLGRLIFGRLLVGFWGDQLRHTTLVGFWSIFGATNFGTQFGATNVWSIVGRFLVGYWWDYGRTSVGSWSDSGGILVGLCWDSGGIMLRFWSDSGRLLIGFW